MPLICRICPVCDEHEYIVSGEPDGFVDERIVMCKPCEELNPEPETP